MIKIFERDMQMRLADFYQEYLRIQDEALLEELVAVSRVRTLAAGEVLFKQGQIPQQVCLLMQGAIRGFLLNVNGKDITDCIVFQAGDSAMPDGEFLKPTSINLEALEPSQIVCADIGEVRRLMKKYPQLVLIRQELLILSAQRHRDLKIVAYQYTAAQRYQWFLKNYPGLIDRIHHKYIASLLNMTPVTLSRIRRELKENVMVCDGIRTAPDPAPGSPARDGHKP